MKYFPATFQLIYRGKLFTFGTVYCVHCATYLCKNKIKNKKQNHPKNLQSYFILYKYHKYIYFPTHISCICCNFIISWVESNQTRGMEIQYRLDEYSCVKAAYTFMYPQYVELYIHTHTHTHTDTSSYKSCQFILPNYPAREIYIYNGNSSSPAYIILFPSINFI